MSTIQVIIPDCATGSHDDNDTITITVENCPTPPPTPPAFITVGPVLIIAIAFLATVIATAIVRYRAHELKPDRLRAKNEARQIELDAEVKMAGLRKRCTTCGDVYEPAIDTA